MHKFATLSRYLHLVRRFSDSGEVDVDPLAPSDAIADWLVAFLREGWWDQWLRDSKVCREIFFTVVARYVVHVNHKRDYQEKRQFTARMHAEEIVTLSDARKHDRVAVHARLDSLGDELADAGFDAPFFHRLYDHGDALDPLFWQKLSYDWLQALDVRIDALMGGLMEREGRRMRGELELLLARASSHMKQAGGSEVESLAAWNSMGGYWTEQAWDKQMGTYQLERTIMLKLVERMGRSSKADGKRHMATSAAARKRLQHATGSDIEGVSIGADLHALMPSEWAHYLDPRLEDVFWYKYSRKSLQVFLSRSTASQQQRIVSMERASQKGPMIVAIDTSASMHGTPYKMSQLMLSLIEARAEMDNRECFLVDFSVDTRAVDLRQRRRDKQAYEVGLTPAEYTFGRGYLPFMGHGTNAKAMISLVCELLNDGNRPFMNADVLIISDFIMPLPPADLQQQMASLTHTGTRFYGLELAHGETWNLPGRRLATEDVGPKELKEEEWRLRLSRVMAGGMPDNQLSVRRGADNDATEPTQWATLMNGGMSQIVWRDLPKY